MPIRICLFLVAIPFLVLPVAVRRTMRLSVSKRCRAIFRQTSDTYTRLTQGMGKTYMLGHGDRCAIRISRCGSTMHGRYVKPTGTFAEDFWRWRNPEFDRLMDLMGETVPEIRD